MANVLKMLSMLRSRTASSMVLLVAMATFGMPAVTYAQTSTEASGSGGSTKVVPQLTPGTTSVHSIRTDSPRDTLDSFLRLAREGEDLLLDYRKNQTRSSVERVRLLGAQIIQLIDLSSVPSASRHEVGSDTLGYLFDILGRVDLPASENVPGADVFDDAERGKWRIPGTPITIVRIEEGPREGEFLFSERTVAIAPVFYQRIRHLPLRESVEIESWHQTLLQLHGPAIPAGLVSALPDGLKQIRLDTPIWKILTVVILSVLATILLLLWHRILHASALQNRIRGQLRRVLTGPADSGASPRRIHFFGFG